MKLRWPTCGALASLLLLPCVCGAEDTVVLATGTDCPVTQMSSLDVRKAYLGVAVRLEGYAIRPLRLSNDERLNQIFLQSVVAMSHKSYERRLLSLALKFGTPRPAEYGRLSDAIDALHRIRCSVVYTWEHELDDNDGLKVIRVLWRG